MRLTFITWQNAQLTSGLLKNLDAGEMVLVSSGFHLQRGALYFAHFGVQAKPVSADHVAAMPSLLPLAYNLAVTDLALHEYAGIVRYDIFNALGWNAARTAPGQA
ncbi:MULTISPECIES: YdcF family protein [unclassified Caballeronia]|uniref:YdcF family protein n=1 Tax=unclassified Caballeronia TaxID=2646786 RepID=UPI0038D37DFB